MTEKRFEYTAYDDGTESIHDKKEKKYYYDMQLSDIEELLNDLTEENEELKSDLKDCKKLKNKRLNKIRNHRAVIEDLGGSIRAYKGKLSQVNDKIEKIREAMEDTGALTKRQLEEILND